MIGIFYRLARRVGGRQGAIEFNAYCCEDESVKPKSLLLSIDDDCSTTFHVSTTTVHAGTPDGAPVPRKWKQESCKVSSGDGGVGSSTAQAITQHTENDV